MLIIRRRSRHRGIDFHSHDIVSGRIAAVRLETLNNGGEEFERDLGREYSGTREVPRDLNKRPDFIPGSKVRHRWAELRRVIILTMNHSTNKFTSKGKRSGRFQSWVTKSDTLLQRVHNGSCLYRSLSNLGFITLFLWYPKSSTRNIWVWCVKSYGEFLYFF